MFVLLINLKLTIANYSLLNIVEHENFSSNNYEIANYFYLKRDNFMLSEEKKVSNITLNFHYIKLQGTTRFV